MAWPIQVFTGRPSALAGHALGVDHVVVEGGVVRHHDQQRQPVVRRGPHRGPAHQEIAVAQDGHREPAAALEGEGGADGHARPGADARAAVHPQVVQRVTGLQVGAVPAEREPHQAGGCPRERVPERIG